MLNIEFYNYSVLNNIEVTYPNFEKIDMEFSKDLKELKRELSVLNKERMFNKDVIVELESVIGRYGGYSSKKYVETENIIKEEEESESSHFDNLKGLLNNSVIKKVENEYKEVTTENLVKEISNEVLKENCKSSRGMKPFEEKVLFLRELKKLSTQPQLLLCS